MFIQSLKVRDSRKLDTKTGNAYSIWLAFALTYKINEVLLGGITPLLTTRLAFVKMHMERVSRGGDQPISVTLERNNLPTLFFLTRHFASPLRQPS